MSRTTDALNQEWRDDYAHSPRGTRALRRWAATEPALRGLEDLDHLLEARTDVERAGEILAAVARHASRDVIAARTLLQALKPGLLTMALRTFSHERGALEEVVALAWLRVRNYPPDRAGSVAGNVLLDVRKDYLAQRRAAAPEPEVLEADPHPHAASRSAEDVALEAAILDDLAAAADRGGVERRDLDVVLRTRLDLATLGEVGADYGISGRYAKCLRWRTERKLRAFLPHAA